VPIRYVLNVRASERYVVLWFYSALKSSGVWSST